MAQLVLQGVGPAFPSLWQTGTAEAQRCWDTFPKPQNNVFENTKDT